MQAMQKLIFSSIMFVLCLSPTWVAVALWRIAGPSSFTERIITIGVLIIPWGCTQIHGAGMLFDYLDTQIFDN